METSESEMQASSATVQAQREWEADPTVWQRLEEPTPFGDVSVDRMGPYADPEYLAEFPTVAEALMELSSFEGMTEEFGRYLRAMVLSRQAQAAPGRVEPVDRVQFEELSARAQLEGAERLEAMVNEVFAWMEAQGMDPGRNEPPTLVSQELREMMLTMRS